MAINGQRIEKKRYRRPVKRSKTYNYTYMIGVFSILLYEKIINDLLKVFLVFYGFIEEKIVTTFESIVKYSKKQWFSFTNMFRWIKFTHQKNKIRLKSFSRPRYTISLYFNLLLNIFKVFCRIVNSLLKIVFPIVAVYFFVFTVQYFYNQELAVNVRVPDESLSGYHDLGIVRDESIFRIAQKAVLEDIKYEEDGDELIYTIPIFSIVTAKESEFIDSGQLRNEIIKSISTDVEEAFGFYIDNKFYGAVTDPTKIQNTLENLKEEKRTGAENEVVGFLQDVRLEENIYLKSSIKYEDDIVSLLTSPQEVKQQYIVKSGDTPSGVASDLGIKYEELKALNENLVDNFIPGKELIIKGEKNFLAIKKTSISRHEETVTYKEEVIADNSSSVGSYKIAQEGEDGLVEIQTEVTTVDGGVIDQIEIGRTTLKEAISEEKLVGTRTYINGEIVYVDPNVQELGTGTFVWPVQSRGRVTNGWLGYRGHRAIDIQSFYGDGTLASDAGVVSYVSYSRYNYGYEVVIDHLNGYQTRYAHNSKILVEKGDFVKQGQVIALQGNTGNVWGRTGIHLHFEIIKNGVKINPRNFM